MKREFNKRKILNIYRENFTLSFKISLQMLKFENITSSVFTLQKHYYQVLSIMKDIDIIVYGSIIV